MLCYSVTSCGRSQVVCEAGAWSLARADLFFLFFLLVVFLLRIRSYADYVVGVSFKWHVPEGPLALGVWGPDLLPNSPTLAALFLLTSPATLLSSVG